MPFGAYAPMPLRLGDDWSSQQHARMCADMVAVKRTMPTAAWSYTKVGSVVTISNYHGMSGPGVLLKPDNVTVNGTGDVSFGWSAQYFVDAYGIMYPLDLTHAVASADEALIAMATVDLTPSTIRIRTSLHSGTARDSAVSVMVW